MPNLGGFPGVIPYRALSAGFNVTPSYAGYLLDVTASGGTVTITLDAAATLASGFRFYVRRKAGSDSNVVIDPSAAETIDGAATLALTDDDELVEILCNGTLFFSLSTSSCGSGAPAAHASTHEDGGADEIDVTGLSGLLADPQTPLTHKISHENGGADEISVAGLSGVLSDPQTPIAHKISHENGGSDELSVAGLSGLLADAQTPTAHSSTHLDTGSDPIDFSLIIGKGAAGDEPAATPENEGYLYVVDNVSAGNYFIRSNGSSWDTVTAPVGQLAAFLAILPLSYQERDEKDQPSGYAGLDSDGLIPVAEIPPISATRERITQAAHGFVAGDVVYLNSMTWTKARADAVATAEAVGIVESAPDADTFVIVYNGTISLSGLSAGAVYFLSDSTAGLLTTTEPTTVGYVSKPLLVAKSTTVGVVHNWRGVRIGNNAIGCPKWMAAMDYATGQSAMFPLVLAQHRIWFGA